MTDIVELNDATPQSDLVQTFNFDAEKLARDFVSLIFPRLINQFAEQAQDQIDALSLMKAEARKDKEAELAKELNAVQVKLKKALSDETMTKVMDSMVNLLKAELTPQELAYAVYQERITIKISGIAARLETAFDEALGED